MARRAAERLSVKALEAILRRPVEKAAMIADGRGLYLRLRPDGDASWTFVTTKGGTRKDIGLGSVNDVTLGKAREKADHVRAALANGIDHKAALSPPPPPEPQFAKTFDVFKDEYIRSVESGWKSEVHRSQWRNTLDHHAKALLDMPVADITTSDVLAVLEPIWRSKPETADRVRGRIERILNAAASLGYRDPEKRNPAEWRGHLENLLPRKNKLSRGHHPALPFSDAPAFMVELRGRPALAARVLEFTILTAARSGEALGAKWGEIDLAKKLWVIPKARMKGGVEHEVPLSSAAIELLESVKPETPGSSDVIFAVEGAVRSNMAMSMLLRRMGRDEITVHGFRSTFRQWTRSEALPEALCEESLSHVVGDKARNAYARGSMAEPRRYIMDAWAGYLDSAMTVPDDDFDALLSETSG